MINSRKIIHSLKNKENSIALQALEMARQCGWLDSDSKSLAKQDLSGANLSNSNFAGAYLFKVDFGKATLTNASFEGCLLDTANFEGATLIKANLQQSNCNYANFHSANLHQAICIGGMFSGAVFDNARLERTNFTGANLDGARLSNADLTETLFERASLASTVIESKLISIRQLTRAHMLTGATLPSGIRYDGRFRLTGDLEFAESIGIDIDSPEEMANRYQVSIETYLAGQAWADDHLGEYVE